MKVKIIIGLLLVSPLLKGQLWKPLPGGSLNGNVSAIVSFGGYLWVGGNFTIAGPIAAQNIVRYDGYQWISTPTIPNAPFDLCIYNSELYALGGFDIGGLNYGAMKWTGSSWLPLGLINNGGRMDAGDVYNGELIVGGRFISVDGQSIEYLTKWNGVIWSSFTGPVTCFWTTPIIRAVHSANGCLYVGGSFDQINGVNSACAAKWNGISWIPMNIGWNTYASHFTSSGSNVYVVGIFQNAGPSTSQAVAIDGGLDWSNVGNGVQISATSTEFFQGNLYVAGTGTVGGGDSVGNCGYWNGSAWLLDNVGINTGLIKVLYTDTINNILYAGGSFTIASGGIADYIAYKSSINLPVEISYFKGGLCGDNVCLYWQTISEKNNNLFEIEKSVDGVSFLKIGQVFGFSNSNIIQNYQFVDNDIFSCNYYYRLKQIDWNGKFNYSKKISVSVNSAVDKVFILKGNSIIFHSNEDGFGLLYNILGQEICEYKFSFGLNNFCLPELNNGMYIFVSSSGKNFLFTK